MAKPAIRKSHSDVVFDRINIFLMLVVLIVMLYPLYFTIIASVSDPYAVSFGKVYLLPNGFTLEAYRNTFADSRIWVGYANTIKYTVLGTLFNLFLTIPAAYVLSKRNLVGRGFLATLFIIPMYFGGGLIPTYLRIRDYGLVNTSVTLIFLGGISIYNVIVSRVYFQTSIPEELYESARIDGLRETGIFLRISLPLAKPILAVMVLYYAEAHWNSYFTALIYTSKSSYQPLQIVLRNILLLNQSALTDIMKDTEMDTEQLLDMAKLAYLAETMKYALIFVSSAPLLAIYPFVQKYFVKGVMIGSLKG